MDANLKQEIARALGENVGGRDLEEFSDLLRVAASECDHASRRAEGRDLRELAGLVEAQV